MKAFIFGFLFLFTAASWGAQTVVVEMKTLSFSPKKVEIIAGQSIIWKNTAYTDHSATSEGAKLGFDTGMISPRKESKPISFDTPGEYSYHCNLHGPTMSGVIVVKPAKK